MNPFLEKLLFHIADLGIDVTKIAKNATGKITPIKKPFFASKVIDADKLKELIDSGLMTKQEVLNHAEQIADLAASGQLNDFEMQRALNNVLSVKPIIKPAPIADVYSLQSGQQVPAEGLESILQSHGLLASPKTSLGKSQLQLKQAEQQLKDMIEKAVGGEKPTVGDYLIQSGKDQMKYSEMEKEGMKRAEARQILEHPEIKDRLSEDQLKRLSGSSLSENDPLKIYEEVFGPKAHQLLPGKGDLDQAQTVAERLLNAKDAKGLDPEHPSFDQESAINNLIKPEEKAKGGRVGYAEGDWVIKGAIKAGKALKDFSLEEELANLAKKHKAAYEAHDQLSPALKVHEDSKYAADSIANTMADMKHGLEDKGKDITDLPQEKQMEYYRKAQRYVDDYMLVKRKNDVVKKLSSGEPLNHVDQFIGKKYGLIEAPETPQASSAQQATSVSPTNWVDTERNRINDLLKYMDDQEKIYGKPNANNKYGLNLMRRSRMKELDLLNKAESKGISFEDYENQRQGLFGGRSYRVPKDLKEPPKQTIDISNPDTAKSFADFAKQNDPEGFAKIQKIVDDINNKNELENFDTTDRKPNANGGLNYLLGL